MQPLQPIYIAGSNSGLVADKKPFLFPETAYVELENAYVWRERVKKREGLELVGRLRRELTLSAAGNYSTIAGTNTFDIFTGLGLTATEPDAQVELGSLTTITITFAAPIGQSLTDTVGTGIMTVVGAGPITSATINYATGILTITASAPAGPAAVTVSLAYYPTLPVMGIPQREIAGVNLEQTIWFDTKYAYIFTAGQFQEFLPGTVWDGTDSDFFWSTNYRGSTPDARLFFTTNFVSTATNPIRYTNGAAWTNFAPLVSATDTMFQARILIPYYGRLVALNVYEGTTAGGYAAAVNIFNRCRFSQIGNPIDVDAWRTDIFGRGGFIDAPTNEAIVSARFFKNTLIVGFEQSTWQLRYVGEYGLPFIWERISSDFGAESTFSTVLFDQGVLQIGDRAINSATATNVGRIDEQIPDQVFAFGNKDFGKERIHGIRDFQKELVYWCFVDPQREGTFPNKTLVYNYRNQTYARFRNNVTAFGILQSTAGESWDSTTITWDDEDVTWDDADETSEFPKIVSGNQQGFVHNYGYVTMDEPSLSIRAIDLTVTPVSITSPNHNLDTGEIIYITGMLFTPTDPGLNGFTYRVTRVDADTFTISQWDGTAYADVTSTSLSTYLGNGSITLFPKLSIQTKDFNPYQQKGIQVKMSYVDFLFDAFTQSAITVTVFVNTSVVVEANLLIGNRTAEGSPTTFGYITGATNTNPCIIASLNHGLVTGDQIQIANVMGMTQLNNNNYTVVVLNANSFILAGVDATGFGTYISEGIWQNLKSIYYVPGSDYTWHRFYSTCNGQFLRLKLSYSDDLMNDLETHMQSWVMNAIALYVRPGGKQVF